MTACPLGKFVAVVPCSRLIRKKPGVPVFFLMSQLALEQDEAIRLHINAINEYQVLSPTFCFIPWSREQDGTLQDAWNILWQMFQHSARNSTNPVFLCIDEQSGVDQTLLVIRADWYLVPMDTIDKQIISDMLKPQLRGIRYTRVHASQARIAMVPASWETGDFCRVQEELELQSLNRPGWLESGGFLMRKQCGINLMRRVVNYYVDRFLLSLWLPIILYLGLPMGIIFREAWSMFRVGGTLAGIGLKERIEFNVD